METIETTPGKLELEIKDPQILEYHLRVDTNYSFAEIRKFLETNFTRYICGREGDGESKKIHIHAHVDIDLKQFPNFIKQTWDSRVASYFKLKGAGKKSFVKARSDNSKLYTVKDGDFIFNGYTAEEVSQIYKKSYNNKDKKSEKRKTVIMSLKETFIKEWYDKRSDKKLTYDNVASWLLDYYVDNVKTWPGAASLEKLVYSLICQYLKHLCRLDELQYRPRYEACKMYYIELSKGFRELPYMDF